MIDTVIQERFQIKERLVRQGVVEIFAGVDVQEGQPVWIRYWTGPITQDLDLIESWRGQMLSVQGIEDGHLPRILAFGRLPDGEMFQVEEPPHGITLRRYSGRHAPLTVAQAVGLAAAAARAVGIGHREGVAHGGLNPETIYIEAEEDGRLEAFITGWEAGDLVVALRSAGEPLPERMARYLSPEQVSEVVPPATPATDVYALGAILYELLTGSLPAASPLRETALPVTPPRRFNPEVPAAIEQVLLRALSRDPAERQPNGQALASALMQALTAPEPAPMPAPPPPPIVERQTVVVQRTFPFWRAFAAFLGLALLCVLIMILWQLQQPTPGQTLASVDATATALALRVPNLKGPPPMRYNEAVQLAWNRGFVVNVVAFRDDPALPPGVIVEQCPQPDHPRGVPPTCQLPGLPAPTDGIIQVEVSSLPEPIVMRVVPDLYGQPEAQARTTLEAGGLRLGIRREAYDLLIPAGSVIEQNPRRGLAVLPGLAVDIIVSAGPPPTSGAGPIVEPELPGEVPIPSEEQPTPAAPLPSPEILETPTILIVPSPTRDVPPILTPTETTGEPTGSETVLLFDDFEQGNTLGWIEDSSDAVQATIDNGLFALQIVQTELFWKTQANRIFDDFTYEATVMLDPSSVDEEAGAGLVFRIQDNEHYYLFQINGADQFRLLAQVDGEFFDLIPWVSDGSVLPAGAPNQLRVVALGERLTLFINGTQVSAYDIPPEMFFPSGDVGLGGQAGQLPLIAVFDNVRLSR